MASHERAGRRPRGRGDDDRRLIARIASGDADALGELYDRHCRRAWALARSLCRDEARAEDAVQEAFIAIWRRSASYRSDRGGVAGWILTIVHHRAIDVTRRERARPASPLSEESVPEPRDASDPAALAVAGELAACVRDELGELPHAQREVVALAFYNDLSHREIASRLGVPLGTVKGRMRIALAKLRDRLELA